jgi:hypothetical protein
MSFGMSFSLFTTTTGLLLLAECGEKHGLVIINSVEEVIRL